jgi:hypothetical protein
MITLAGPQSGSVATNFPRGIEEAVNWCSGLLEHMRKTNSTRVEAKAETEIAWGEQAKVWLQRILFGREQSWFTGYNSNVDREPTTRNMIYAGGAQRYREHLSQEVSEGYPVFEIQ